MATSVNQLPLGSDTARFQLFCRLWGVALMAHVIGNWSQPDFPTLVGAANLMVGILGLHLTFAPNRRSLVLAAVATIVSVLAEMPFTGNHWLLAGLVSLAAILTKAGPRHLMPAARWILLVFYAFAAFAKLNPGFFDPSVSCALLFANQTLASLGLPTMSSSSAWSMVPIWVSALIELSVPVLLIVRPARHVGVLIASTFHILISFDLGQHFYDFTAVLLPLFFLFTSDDAVKRLEGRLHRWRPRGSVTTAVAVVIVVLVGLAVLTPTRLSVNLLRIVPFVLWIPTACLWLYALVTSKSRGQTLSWKPGLAGIAVGLAIVNGLTPYTELKTAYGFNMYANLVTAGGESNHFLISSTLRLRDGYDGPVQIVSASDPGLELYRDLGYLIAFPQLRQYLAPRPEISLTYRRNGETIALDRAGNNAQFSDSGPWWWRFMALRAIDSRSPPRCQDVFLPAL